ncbi:MAG: hypothetical protein ACRDRX_25240 [Pseudonocardiaceae bacterium]
MSSIVNGWNVAYFDNRLSPAALAALEALNEASTDAQALADRTFRLMRVARLDARDLSVHTARILGAVTRSVPSAWDGAVPPITLPGRHQKLDDYIAGNSWHRPGREPVLLDLGCGFPPVTALDSATTLAGWRVIGVDPSFDRYIIYDGDDYACFDDDQFLRFFHTSTVASDPALTRARFRDLWRMLLPLLPAGNDGEPAEVEYQGARLVLNPLRYYERANLRLTHGEIGSVDIEGGVDVIRCMNVFMYFDHAFRERALVWATGLVRPGGLFICGNNWAYSTSSRYTVYQEHDGRLVPREFALSIDNLRPVAIAPWYALHDDSHENICNAEAVGIIRDDDAFRARFDERLDALLAQKGICRRRPDGYLGAAGGPVTHAVLDDSTAAITQQLEREGFVDDAVTVLRRAGRHAWRNAAGHIAMRPVPPRPFPAPAVELYGRAS